MKKLTVLVLGVFLTVSALAFSGCAKKPSAPSKPAVAKKATVAKPTKKAATTAKKAATTAKKAATTAKAKS